MWKDSETDFDLLNYEIIVKSIMSIIENETLLPSSIGIFGDWGSGKSSLMKMISNQLSQDPDTVCVTFNGWLFEGYEDAKSALLGTILDTIVEKRKSLEKVKKIITGLYKSINIFRLFKLGISLGTAWMMKNTEPEATPAILMEGISTLSEGVASAKDEIAKSYNLDSLRNDLASFRDSFSYLIGETKIRRLVVFIDELDRCSPSTIIETLEAIRLFLFIGNTSFVIGADERHIAYAIRSRYKDIDDKSFNIGKEYLEKMIQYPFRIPKLSEDEVEVFISLLLADQRLNEKEYNEFLDFVKMRRKQSVIHNRLDLVDIKHELPNAYDVLSDIVILTKQIAPIIANGFKGNPRQCKRFLNMLEIRQATSKLYGLTVDITVMVKLMLLEYFSGFYEKIEKLVMENRANQIIGTIEKDGFSSIDEFKILDDEWHRNWLLIKPSLVDVDLEPYIYVARDQRKHESSQTYRSSKKEDLLYELMSDSEIAVTNALSKVKLLDSKEIRTLFLQLFESIIPYRTIPTSKFKAFVQVGVECQLIEETMIYIDKLDPSQISLPLLPYLKKLGQDDKLKKKTLVILEKWQKSNTALSLFKLQF